jgi:hypothetical protein
MSDLPTIRRLLLELRTNHELRREAYSMSLYVSIVLLSALSIFNDSNPPEHREVLLVEVGATVGLVLAHGFASWVSTQMIGRNLTHGDPWGLLRVQLGAASAICLIATLAVLIAPPSIELEAARLTVAGVIGALVYLESRTSNSAARAGAYGLLALVGGVGIAAVKAYLYH